ncbi:glycosyltransferase [Salinimicrobium sp. CAU 1759]
MRVLQLIDSLRPGGAEKMSVTYANALAKRIDASFLCCTRKEGLLKKQLTPEVGYLFLNKKSTLDLEAFLKLRKFVKENKIDFIQAHSSSWFLALMVKLSLPGLKLIWHDHYGRNLKERKIGILRPASRFFDGVISVNYDLKEWAEENLMTKKIRFFRNFLPEAALIKNSATASSFQGSKDDFKILCLANLRPQKDHLNLLKAFELVVQEHPQTSLHLVGRDDQDVYSGELMAVVKQEGLTKKVFFYGEQENVEIFLKEADLGILSSASEGLPVALLEYGRAGLAVVSTDVGQCAEVIGSVGKLVTPKDPKALAQAIKEYIEDSTLIKSDARSLQESIRSNYSEAAVMPQVEEFFNLNFRPGTLNL